MSGSISIGDAIFAVNHEFGFKSGELAFKSCRPDIVIAKRVFVMICKWEIDRVRWWDICDCIGMIDRQAAMRVYRDGIANPFCVSTALTIIFKLSKRKRAELARRLINDKLVSPV